MTASSSGTDLEAQFRLRLFALLGSSSALRQLVHSKSSSASSARLDLARFLAAYFLGIDFARLFEQLNRCYLHQQVEAVRPIGGGLTTATTTVLPNLMLCEELADEDEQHNQQQCHAVNHDRTQSACSSVVWERSRLGQLLPPECTPNLALMLLLREQRCLEAIFFADHFHDSRTSMALRFLVDRHFPGLNLLAQFCRATLIDQLLDSIEFGEFDDGHEKRVHQFIEAIIQADVLFPEEFGGTTGGLLNDCLQAVASKMSAQFGELFEIDAAADHHHHAIGDDQHRAVVALQMPTNETIQCLSAQLPRPPIYCANDDFAMFPSSTARCHALDPETRAWLLLHACCTTLAHALARSNRLEQLIGFFALWLGRQNESQSDVPFLLEAEYFTNGQTDDELAIDMATFQTVFSIAVGMEIRDKLVRQLADKLVNTTNASQNSKLEDAILTKGRANDVIIPNCRANNDEAIQNYNAKLCILASPFYDNNNNKLQQTKHEDHHQQQQMIWPSLKRWAQLADQRDIESAMLFLHTIQQQNVPTRSFLPPLNAQNRSKWCSLLLMDTSAAAAASDHQIGTTTTTTHWVDHLEVFVDEQQKFKLLITDFVRLHFVAHRFPLVPLSGQPIQILLQLDPNEICCSVGGHDNDRTFGKYNCSNTRSATDQLVSVPTKSDQQPSHRLEEDDAGGDDGLERIIAQIRTSLARLDDKDDDNDGDQRQRRPIVASPAAHDDDAQIRTRLAFLDDHDDDQRRRLIVASPAAYDNDAQIRTSATRLEDNDDQQRRQMGATDVPIRTKLAILDDHDNDQRRRQIGGSPVAANHGDLNMGLTYVAHQQSTHEARRAEMSSGDEHAQQMRGHLHDQLVLVRQQMLHRRRRTSSAACSTTSARSSTCRTSGEQSCSGWPTSSSTSNNIRAKTSLLSNKISRRHNTTRRKASFVCSNEEPSDEQLMQEMDTIGHRLEWIRQQFQQRTVTEQSDNVDEEAVLPDSFKKNGIRQSNSPNSEPEKSKPQNPATPLRQTTKSGSFQPENRTTVENSLDNLENAENKKPNFAHAEGDKHSTFVEHGQNEMGSIEEKNAETGKPTVNQNAKIGTMLLTEIRTIEGNNAKVEKPTADQNAEIGTMFQTTTVIDGADQSALCRPPTPPSSAGYHSSRPSTSNTCNIVGNHDDVQISGANGAEQLGNNDDANQYVEYWRQNANKFENAPLLPPAVERMDFRGLRSSSDEADEADIAHKKPKRRLWKEIEVFPRNSPSPAKFANPPPAFLVNNNTCECAKSVPPKLSDRSDAGHAGGAKVVERQIVQAPPRRSPWRRPQWLRLLPPFDGTIRTERQTAQMQHAAAARPLLELRLDDLFTTPRCHGDEAPTIAPGNLTNPRERQRTFLELAANKEHLLFGNRQRRCQKSAARRPKSGGVELEHQKQQPHQPSSSTNGIGIYDSGIGLDQQQQQQQQQHHRSNDMVMVDNIDGINSTRNVGSGLTRNVGGTGIVLYTAELDEADVVAMRRRAAGQQKSKDVQK